MGKTGRYALVIGNGAYGGEWWPLKSPPRDAEATGALLVKLGFDVDCARDLGFDAMNAALDSFARKVAAAARVEAALFYYSGHGCAREGQNFMLPTDFDDPASSDDRLLRVQSVIDRISSARADEFVKIVLFDACRVGDNEAGDYERRLETAVQGKSIRDPDGGQRLASPGEIRSKFTTMTGEANTFIAFATAVGRPAYGTLKGLSPFTAALVRNLDAVDLPLTNLLSRVRIEVGKRTGQAQNTWDQSSLEQPFFFNPGSILLFAGNAMALVGLVLSLIPYSLVLAAGLPWTWMAAAAVPPILSLAILLYGMQSVYTRLKGSFDVDEGGPLTWRKHFAYILQKGVLGGYLGALVGGLAIGGTYYLAWARVDRVRPGDYDPLMPLGAVLTEITLAAALAACLLGFLSLAGAGLGWDARAPRLITRPSPQRIVFGGILGGVATGLLAAPVITVYFGLKCRPDMTPNLLIPGSLAGAALIVFSIVNFDLERLTLKRIAAGVAASFAALALGGLFAALVIGFFYVIGLVNWDTNFLHAHDRQPWLLAAGGAIYGAPVGAILGFVIGIAAVLTSRWSGAAVLGRASEIDAPTAP